SVKKIAVLASGNGSNAEKIIAHFKKSDKAEVSLIASNNKEAFVLERAKNHGIPFYCFDKSDLTGGKLKETLLRMKIDLVVLAGFLLKVPDDLIDAFPNKIVNIHPALLPKFGGKGMYGSFVHKAV